MDESGQDSLKASIDANYKQIKQEILALVDVEIKRIENDPELNQLLKD